MQIVSQAIFQHLKQAPLNYTATHNRLAYLTSNELIVRQIAINPKYSSLKVRGKDIVALSLQNPHYIAILYKKGVLQIRKNEALQSLIFTATQILIFGDHPKLRVTLDAVYVLCGKFVERISLSGQRQRQQFYLSEKQNDYAEDMLISSILQQQKVLVFKFGKVLSFEIQGIPLARLQMQRIDEIKLLRDPLLIGNADMKQYMIVVEMNKWLKIYDVLTLRQILQMELFLQRQETIDIKIDPLHQYIMLRIYNKQTNKTIKNSLLKVNKQYYLHESEDPFFLFDIEVGLKQDLILFPTHLQIINGQQFHSIDMCYFTHQHIKIATLVVDINHRTKLYHTQHMDPTWESIEHWDQIVSNLKSQKPQQQKKVKQFPQIQNNNSTQLELNILIKQFLQQSLQKFQSEAYVFNFDKPNDQIPKCIEYPVVKNTIKDNIETEDALNTLSGSSSFRSSTELYNEETLLKMIQGVDLSMQSQNKKQKLSDVSIKQPDYSDSDISETHQSLLDLQKKVEQIFKPFDQKIEEIDNKLGRIEDIHVKKLKKIERTVRQHKKQMVNIQSNITKWCEDQMSLFAAQVKNNVGYFNNMVGRLEISGNRKIKKIKKNYRDFLDEQIQSRQQKAEQNEQGTNRKIQNLMRELQKK